MKKLLNARELRSALLVAAGVAMAASVGCASQRVVDDEAFCRMYSGVSPVLLLDAPGLVGPDAQLFAGRSNWPATQADTDLGQVTDYQEYWYDRQSARPHYRDYTYRLFRSRTEGQRIR